MRTEPEDVLVVATKDARDFLDAAKGRYGY